MSLFGGEATATPEGVETMEEVVGDITAADEIDSTEDGIPGHAVIAKITSAAPKNTDGEDGATNLLFNITFSVLNSPHININANINATFWRNHTNPKAQTIGRGSYKTLVEAAVGKNTEGRVVSTLDGLVGRYITAWAKDNGGFPQLGRWKKVSEAALDEALAASGVGDLT